MLKHNEARPQLHFVRFPPVLTEACQLWVVAHHPLHGPREKAQICGSAKSHRSRPVARKPEWDDSAAEVSMRYRPVNTVVQLGQ